METLTVAVEWPELHSSSKSTMGGHSMLAVWENPSITNSSWIGCIMGGPRVSWEGQFQEDTVAWRRIMLSVYRCVLCLTLLSMAKLVTATHRGRRHYRKRWYCILNNSMWNSLTGHSLIFRHTLVNWLVLSQWRKPEFTTQFIIMEAGMAPGLW